MSGWQPIETAPRVFEPAILAYARGVDGRPMIQIVRWANPETMFRSDILPVDEDPAGEWVGEMGTRYGVPMAQWMPLPVPPEQLRDAP